MNTRRVFHAFLGLAGTLALAGPAAANVSTLTPGNEGVWDTGTSSSAYQSDYGGWEHLASGTDLVLFPLQLSPESIPTPDDAGSGSSSSTLFVGVSGVVPTGDSMKVVLLAMNYDGSSYSQTSQSNCGVGNNILQCGNWSASSGLGLSPTGTAIIYISMTGNGVQLMSVISYNT
jgi:hypothetical protein